eukprot:Rmarinus@m.9311
MAYARGGSINRSSVTMAYERYQPDYADKQWPLLQQAVHQIWAKNSSSLSYEELYRTGYNLCLYKHSEFLFSKIRALIASHHKEIANRIHGFHGETFLKHLDREFRDDRVASGTVRDVLMYMDENFLRQLQKTDMYTVAMDSFCNHVSRDKRIRPKLRDTMLSLIEKERIGEVIDKSVLQNAVAMLVHLGFSVYVEDFESPFLEMSHSFYKTESDQYINDVSCSEYMKKAERRLKEERERVEHYLDSRTEEKIREVVETRMIFDHIDTLLTMPNSGILFQLEHDRYDDLRRMYEMFRRVKTGLQKMKQYFSDYIKDCGRKVVTDETTNVDPVEYVGALVKLYTKFQEIIKQSFHQDKTFVNSLNTSFEVFINENSRSAEYLSLFLNQLLRQGSKTTSDDDFEKAVENAISMFRYLQDKDVFELYYKHHLAKRLLSKKSVSEDAEEKVIKLLKEECGSHFTQKIDNMFNDIKISRDLSQDFKEYASKKEFNGVDLSVTVLTTGSWPSPVQCSIRVPEVVVTASNLYREFYESRFSGRKLTWQLGMGTADIRGYFAKNRYEFSCSTVGMCILLLFNQEATWTYEAMLEELGVPAVELKRNLQSLACAKFRVLSKEPKGKDVCSGDVFSFNESFSSKLVRFKIMTVTATKETEAEKIETRARIDDDRKPQIEAAIVRTMKARKLVEHSELVAEVMKQLQSFVPNPTDIKKRIENLIERDYMERDEKDTRTYKYLA